MTDALGPFALNQVHCMDCLEAMRQLPDGCVDAVVTDPPYELGFMRKKWDGSGVAFRVETWAAALRVAKPGAHLLAFGGTRTFHRLACAIEDAGWEIRDCIMWVYGSGFPKSLDVSKAIDKAAGAKRVKIPSGSPVRRMIPGADQNATGSWIKDDGRQFHPGIELPATDAARQWSGWGTALKPAWEPIIVARKPLDGTVAANVLKHGTGALNIDGSRVGSETLTYVAGETGGEGGKYGKRKRAELPTTVTGRFPANLIHDGSEECLAAFPEAPGQIADASTNAESRKTQNVYGAMRRGRGDEPSADSENDGAVGFKMRPGARRLDAGSAARFFYCAKANKADRGPGNDHPTVKPLDLMRYLCRLVTPPGGIVLDPFGGSGRTGVAALQLGFRFLGFDLDPHHVGGICAPALEAAAKGITPAELKEGQGVLFGGSE